MSATRWPRESLDQEVDAANLIHARMSHGDEFALCERGAELLPRESVTLSLDLARANPGTVTRPVDCPQCLEWMHA